MIIILLPDDSPEARAEEVCQQFAEVIHSRVPMNHSVDLHHFYVRQERGYCGDCMVRVVPTHQELCPRCGGTLHDAEIIDRMRALARDLASI